MRRSPASIGWRANSPVPCTGECRAEMRRARRMVSFPLVGARARRAPVQPDHTAAPAMLVKAVRN
ncbi:conserved hypothetical protein [Ricinus communis]|uniref:Uncharacterized protein n=1 Tax=Ricinus communis TaxID=3988 RepID=B9T982_RICCO|nr:conserved hypothetical protein [Ricinus communis]